MQNPQLVPVAVHSPELAYAAAVAQTVAHSTVMVAAVRALAHVVAAWVAIAAAMTAAAAYTLTLMGNHDNYTERNTVHYFDLHAVLIALRCAALLAAHVASQFQWCNARNHHPPPSDASPDCPATAA